MSSHSLLTYVTRSAIEGNARPAAYATAKTSDLAPGILKHEPNKAVANGRARIDPG